MVEQQLNRDERAARRTLEKQFLAGFKLQAKANGWGYLKPTAFRRVGDWFISLHPVIYTDARRAALGAIVKPFAIDELMSQICGHGGLEGAALSLRARGPHCLVRPMWEADIESGGNIDEMLALSDGAFTDALLRLETLRLSDFVAFTSGDTRSDEVSYNHVAALILVHRKDDAMELCRAAIARKQWGGPSRVTEDGRMIGFFELAAAWLEKN